MHEAVVVQTKDSESQNYDYSTRSRKEKINKNIYIKSAGHSD